MEVLLLQVYGKSLVKAITNLAQMAHRRSVELRVAMLVLDIIYAKKLFI
jgi:hypothetical protein